jgi:peroxiredoxin
VQRVIETLKQTDVLSLPVSIDMCGASAVQPYMTEHHLTFTALFDQHQEVARQFGVRGTPTTVVVNRAGQIVARGMGPAGMESPAFQRYLQALLTQSPSQSAKPLPGAALQSVAGQATGW